ncbi:asialoglycoprotein receptor 1 [Anolis carolinensis]|uniref:asialoglycoprotein receptor 1 n=1 Tax=Anolis carolinensis TaxID=28377 RepID=UPI002F2B26BC
MATKAVSNCINSTVWTHPLTLLFFTPGRKLNADLSGMQGNLKSINQTLFSELASLKEKGASEAKLVAKINAMAKNLTEEVKEAKTQFRDQISKLQSAVLTMNCELEDAKHNRTGTSKRICCPKGWFPFARNCYWFSNSEKTWEEAKLDCENKEAHLAIITTYLEKMFVVQHTKPHNFWIGLSFVNRTWKWVDGTAYAMRRIDWRPQEPNNFSFLVPMESADCVHIYRDGLWSDEHCQYRYNWVCEMEAKG